MCRIDDCREEFKEFELNRAEKVLLRTRGRYAAATAYRNRMKCSVRQAVEAVDGYRYGESTTPALLGIGL